MSVVALVGVLALTGCGSKEAPAPAAPSAPPAVSSAERGPVHMEVRLDAGEVTVGEKLGLTVDVTAEAGVAVEMPTVEEKLGPFAVRGRSTPPDVPEGLNRHWTHHYVLDTFEAGDAEVPAISVTFTDSRPGHEGRDGAPVEGTLSSEPLAVAVRSVLGPEGENAEPRDIRGGVDVDLPFALSRRGLLGAGLAVAALAVAALAIVLLLRHRRRRAARVPVIPPHEWAIAELARLAEADLVGRGEVYAFYVRLSDIVRQYVERRFGLMAPERTTEEFLREARHSAALRDEDKELLGGFLRAADMVKFALHRPTSGECRSAFEAARGFVVETRPREAAPEEPGEAGAREAAA